MVIGSECRALDTVYSEINDESEMCLLYLNWRYLYTIDYLAIPILPCMKLCCYNLCC